MTTEEKIKKILDDAQAQIMVVLKGDDKMLAEASANIEATADKIMKDAFTAKTFLVDENNIDKSRLDVLEMLTDDDIKRLYDSCKEWCETGKFVKDSEYVKFCTISASVRATFIEDEMRNNIDVIIFKYKQINVDHTGFTN